MHLLKLITILPLGCIYGPKKDIQLDGLINQLDLLSASYPEIIIAGDFNYNWLADVSLTGTAIMLLFNLFPINESKLTQFTNTNSTYVRDLFFISNKDNVLRYDQLMAPPFPKLIF